MTKVVSIIVSWMKIFVSPDVLVIPSAQWDVLVRDGVAEFPRRKNAKSSGLRRLMLVSETVE